MTGRVLGPFVFVSVLEGTVLGAEKDWLRGLKEVRWCFFIHCAFLHSRSCSGIHVEH